MNYKRFEDMEVWQLSRKLIAEIYDITNFPDFNKDFALRDQIRRSSISVISNISEGFERKSNKKFVQFLHIAKGSAGELRAQLYIAYDLHYLLETKFQDLLGQIITISKSLSGLIKYLTNSNSKIHLKSDNF